MTKQEAIDKTNALLEVLRDMPDDDGIDIISAEIHYSNTTNVHLYTGIEILRDAFSVPVVEIKEDGEYTRHNIQREEINIFLLRQ